ncbi:LacI family transcriptional regulator [Spongiactinospora rosea]|uniref:LacI family transcriptional regulator n=1 Tax=Spongiactinospora rosea TaxID=2248750 RepID=A0A366M0L8_9ACTN|nr:LacI family DNA-binding transcriptional regulator [Spongiactinospora rosea]RBQ18972.1 LacI family transcriptional regulator [Spongiactinospora rosea]
MSPATGGRHRPTMRDVAREAQVSVMTVSRVVNGGDPVNPQTRQRVLDAIERLGFRPNSLARGLRHNRSTGLIGLVVTNLANPFYSRLAVAVEETARRLGLALIVGNTDEDAARERQLVEDLLARRVDGLIIVPAGEDHGYLAGDLTRGTSVVFCSRPPRGIDADVVTVDDFGGARDAVAGLAAKGHHRIGYIGHLARIHTGGERLNGYLAALADAGLPAAEELVRVGITGAEEAERAAADLLGGPAAPTALFTSNNLLTVGALRAMRTLRAVGGAGTELVGFDDFDLADMLEQPFSVVAYDAELLGRTVTDLLADRLAGETGPPRAVVIGTRPAPRGTLAARQATR